MIISFLNQKGGVGRTTLSINVAEYLAHLGYRVLLIDANKQASASTWASYREDPTFQVVNLARSNMAKEAITLAGSYDHTIIDGPPRDEDIARSCIIASDYVALPIEPSGLSTWASNLTVRQVREAQEIKPSLGCGFVISRKIGNTVIGRDIRTMAARIGIPILKAEMEQRVAFAESLTMGQTIFEWAAESAAAQEIQNLTQEIQTYVSSGAGHDTRSNVPNRMALQTTAEPTKRLSLDLPQSLHKRFKLACIATDRSMVAELQTFIEHRTEKLEKKAGIHRS